MGAAPKQQNGAVGANGSGGPKEGPRGVGKNKSNAKKRITPKQPKARVARILKKREPQMVEDAKATLLLRGTKASQDVVTVLKDLVSQGEFLLCTPPMLASSRLMYARGGPIGPAVGWMGPWILLASPGPAHYSRA
jgi:hypothetical protein